MNESMYLLLKFGGFFHVLLFFLLVFSGQVPGPKDVEPKGIYETNQYSDEYMWREPVEETRWERNGWFCVIPSQSTWRWILIWVIKPFR